jgi:hypothetical protein
MERVIVWFPSYLWQYWIGGTGYDILYCNILHGMYVGGAGAFVGGL